MMIFSNKKRQGTHNPAFHQPKFKRIGGFTAANEFIPVLQFSFYTVLYNYIFHYLVPRSTYNSPLF